MNLDSELLIGLVPGTGMILVAVLAVACSRRVLRAQYRWFWIGAALWTVAVGVKVACALATNEAVLGWLKQSVPYPAYVALGGLFVGVQSSLCEIGFTLLSVLIWRPLGRESGRAIAIGVGAGAFEAFLLGAGVLVAVSIAIAGLPGSGPVREEFSKAATISPLFWLIGPVERIIAILCHASSRALVLLGAAHRRFVMVFWGFLLFTAMDAVAGAVHVSGKMGSFSLWWIELAILPLAIISIPILQWCYRRFGEQPRDPPPDMGPATAEASG